ncbi:zinc finger domain-containing protein [Saccharothrix texasensis]|uniref:zinc finger domain-containing protein n=1 Tax=Saccharothrix texasensis TaxID=103734 RepID=UPI0014768DEB|nr:hypothetical protein [Saccharothrix texasensis]
MRADVTSPVGRLLRGHLADEHRRALAEVVGAFLADDQAPMPVTLAEAFDALLVSLRLPGLDLVVAPGAPTVDPWRVECPACAAAPWHPCRGVGATVLHVDRLVAVVVGLADQHADVHAEVADAVAVEGLAIDVPVSGSLS